MTIPSIINLNIISVHFHSKVNWSSASLALECTNLSRDIAIIENDTNCENTILIGDFNMNPFEDGIVAANGLNAIQDLNYSIQREKRIIDRVSYKYFYNPMWNFLEIIVNRMELIIAGFQGMYHMNGIYMTKSYLDQILKDILKRILLKL